LLFCSGAVLKSQNLLPNPGFEEGISTGHELVAINGSVVDFSGEDVLIYEGDSALKIDIQVVGTGGPQVIGIRNTLSGLDAGGSYTYKAAVKGPAGQEFRFRILGDDKNTLGFVLPDNEYHIYEYALDPLGSSSSGDYLFAIEFAFTGNSAGIWYIDDQVLEKNAIPVEPENLDRVFVSPDGDDDNSGTLESPFRSVAYAISRLVGDTVYLLEGNYHESISLSSFSGTPENPKVITSWEGQRATFNGTRVITSPWVQYEGSIYKTTLDEDIWQLFVNDKMLNLCRWPDVDGYIDDIQPEDRLPLPRSLWDQPGTWGHSAESSSNGIMIDDGAMALSTLDKDLTGAIAVLNIGSFKTSASPVTAHAPGNNFFVYDSTYTDPYLTWQKPKMAYYYLEGKLNLLDKPGEWYYDYRTGELYLMMKDQSNPETAVVRGKDQSYAFSFMNCNYLVIKDIDFFATTITGDDCMNMEVRNCEFSYPSYSRRILNEYGEIDITLFSGNSDNLSFSNNVIQYTEGEALHVEGEHVLIENNLMRHIDFSCVNLRLIGGTVNFKTPNNTFRYNTIYIAGASETVTPGPFNTVERNEIWGIGHLQNDGSMIQYMVSPTVGSITRYNWLHDCVKSGMRYDGSLDIGNTGLPGIWIPWEDQTKGMVYGNAIWNLETGLMIKGDYHVIVNNTVFNAEKVGIAMINPPPDGANPNSICRNNLADMISGYRGGDTPDKYPIPGIHSNNWNGYYEQESVSTILNDIANRDFRPVSEEKLIEKGTREINSDDLFPTHSYIDSTFDIGAYEYGDTLYAIPGRRERYCTHPIPLNSGTTNAENVMLAWRPAWEAGRYRLYMGTNEEEVTAAGPESSQFITEQEENMYIPGPLYAGEEIYWRVDALAGDLIIKGETWHFSVGQCANGAVFDTTSDINFIAMSENQALAEVEVSIDGAAEITGPDGMCSFSSLRNGNTFTYFASKSGYNPETGIVVLKKDTTVVLEFSTINGIRTMEDFSIRIFPNPVDEVLYVEFSMENGMIEIIDMQGKLILKEETDKNTWHTQVREYLPGLYLIKVSDREHSEWKPVIINR